MANFIKPPRAESAIPLEAISGLEKQNWWCQYKKNGTCSVIIVSPDGKLTTFNRYGEAHKAWAFTDKSSKIFKKLATPDGDTTFVAELLHSKVPGIRDINYIHDILRYNGKLLYGEMYKDRYALLSKLLVNFVDSMEYSHFKLNDNTWLAKNIFHDFIEIATRLSAPEDEGLVFKDPAGIFTPSPSGWTVKYRKPTKNFSF